MDTDENRSRLNELPDHERDDDVDETVGGGIMQQGGTAIDRGTGTLDGVAQGPDAGRDTDETAYDQAPADDVPAVTVGDTDATLDTK